jgi:hypothetical protein
VTTKRAGGSRTCTEPGVDPQILNLLYGLILRSGDDAADKLTPAAAGLGAALHPPAASSARDGFGMVDVIEEGDRGNARAGQLNATVWKDQTLASESRPQKEER